MEAKDFVLIYCLVLCVRRQKSKQKMRLMCALALSVCIPTHSYMMTCLPWIMALRRNHPTLHCKYDEVSAILIGDGLNTYSFYLLANAHFAPSVVAELISCLAENGGIGGMVLGQALDCHFEHTTLPL